MQKLKEAEAEEQLAIKIFKAKSGADSIEVAACMRDLAPRFLIENKTKQGIDYLEQALAIFEKKLPDSLEYANCAEQLGGAYYSIGRYVDAEDLSRKALAIYQKRSGPNSADVAIALTNLGGRLEKESKNKEAIDAYHKSLAIMEKAVAANTDKSNDLTSSISKNLIGLAEVYVDQVDYKRAENVLRRDLEIREKRWGAKHPALIPALRNLSNCLIIQGTSQEESDVLRTREQEIWSQIPPNKRKAINEFIQHEIIKSLDLGTKKERKKSDMW
jgi:tetratricopeptide (TPR) repeat protein